MKEGAWLEWAHVAQLWSFGHLGEWSLPVTWVLWKGFVLVSSKY